MFGALQIFSVYTKLEYFKPLDQPQGTEDATDSTSQQKRNVDPNAEHLFFCDCWHALLSLTAKIFLAWLLMGPAASVNIDKMKKDEFRKLD
jgi:hypothetical protein